jgi:hypothetical protein
MRLKPDITAPGTNTRSAWNTNDTTFVSISGTSMATPHIAGAVALLWSAHPELKNNPDATEPVLNDNAVHILSNGCDSGSPKTPNNTYGNGRVDILAAVNAEAILSLTSAASVKTQGSQSFGLPLPLTGEPGVECRDLAGRQTLVFTFSDNVVSGSAALTAGVGRVQGSAVFSGNTMTVNLNHVSDVQKITVTLTNVMSVSGQTIPSVSVSMNVLAGDVDASKTVDQNDQRITNGQVGMPITTSNYREDVRTDGTINSKDVRQVKENLGHNLP